LYVGSLPYSIENNELEELFAACGEVKSAKVIMDPATGQSKGFGFVEMSTAEEAKEAITTLNGSSHGGRSIVVSEAKPESKSGTSRGAGGNRGSNERGGRGSSGGGWR
jgi:RNA recognition motif-containing protein